MIIINDYHLKKQTNKQTHPKKQSPKQQTNGKRIRKGKGKGQGKGKGERERKGEGEGKGKRRQFLQSLYIGARYILTSGHINCGFFEGTKNNFLNFELWKLLQRNELWYKINVQAL